MFEELLDFSAKPKGIVLLKEHFLFTIVLLKKLLFINFFCDLHQIVLGQIHKLVTVWFLGMLCWGLWRIALPLLWFWRCLRRWLHWHRLFLFPKHKGKSGALPFITTFDLLETVPLELFDQFVSFNLGLLIVFNSDSLKTFTDTVPFFFYFVNSIVDDERVCYFDDIVVGLNVLLALAAQHDGR